MKVRKQRSRHLWALWVVCLLLVALLMPLGAAADDTEEVQTQRYAGEGHYAIAANGVGMLDSSTGDISLALPGTAVQAAFLYWSGTAPMDGGDDTITFARDGAVVAPNLTADTSYGPSFWYDGFYYFVWVVDVTQYVQVGDHTYTVSEFDGNMRRRDGAGLMVVYEDASLPTSAVVILDGLDRFYRGWGEGARGESAVNCAVFDLPAADREFDFVMFLGEIQATDEEPRPNALWYQTGTALEPMPADMVNAPTDGPTTGILLDGPPQPYPFESWDDPQWDTYFNSVTIPQEDTWFCLQLESARDEDFKPASGMWMVTGGSVPIEEIDTPTPTPTPTDTPTPTPTDTPTPTNTPSQPPPDTPTPTTTPTKPPPPPPPVVPEASTLILLGGSATGLAAYVALQIRSRRREP